MSIFHLFQPYKLQQELLHHVAGQLTFHSPASNNNTAQCSTNLCCSDMTSWTVANVSRVCWDNQYQAEHT